MAGGAPKRRWRLGRKLCFVHRYWTKRERGKHGVADRVGADGTLPFPELGRPSIQRGIAYLLRSQKPDGSWSESRPTGTGFPGVLYLRYDYYRRYWPLRALAIYSSCLKRLKN